MKSNNIIKKLENQGYKITFKKWGYWNNIPHVQLNGFNFAIAEYVHFSSGSMGINLDFIYNHVLEALDVVKTNNLILLKKIEESPTEDWLYSRYIIRSMEDYYSYKKNIYPFDDEYWTILEQLKNEVE